MSKNSRSRDRLTDWRTDAHATGWIIRRNSPPLVHSMRPDNNNNNNNTSNFNFKNNNNKKKIHGSGNPIAKVKLSLIY